MSRRRPRAAAKSGDDIERRRPTGAAAAPSSEIAIETHRPAPTLAARLLPLVLVALGVIAYANSFDGVFLLDDKIRIVLNLQIRQFWPPWMAIAGSTRPILDLSLAFNYALGGLNPWGYHAFNLAVHVLCGLVLFGIVRRMLTSDGLVARYGDASRGLAMAVAAIWLVHPLQTESVTYVIQRAESLMGLFYLLTLYCGIRACGSPHPQRWSVAAVVACAFGMGTKEVMVSAPIVMLLYDRTLVAGSFKAALRERRSLYAGLAATWLVLAACLANGLAQEDEVRLVAGQNPWSYALTQGEVIVHYLRLSLWPDPLILDYAWPIAQSWSSAAPAVALVLALLGGTVFAVAKRMWIGFWGAWFFLILAPTSSVLPIADVAFEHRMYLPLAAVVVAIVIAAYDLLVRLGGSLRVSGRVRVWVAAGLVVAMTAALGYPTVRRNEDYRSELAMWTATVAKRPENPRAHVNLGVAYRAQGKLVEAVTEYREALRIKPDYAEAHNNLGGALAIQGWLGEGIAEFSEAIRVQPEYADAHLNLATALYDQGNKAEAFAHFNEAVRINPNHAGAHNSLGIALARDGKLDEAAVHFARALRIEPGFTWARDNLRKVEDARRRGRGAR